MAFGDWDDVIKIYKEVYLHSKYSEHAQAMLDLIPKLRELPDFEGVLPGTSLGALFFEYPEVKETLRLHYEGQGNYMIYLYYPDIGEFGENRDEKIVKSDTLVSTIQTLLRKLKKRSK